MGPDFRPQHAANQSVLLGPAAQGDGRILKVELVVILAFQSLLRVQQVPPSQRKPMTPETYNGKTCLED